MIFSIKKKFRITLVWIFELRKIFFINKYMPKMCFSFRSLNFIIAMEELFQVLKFYKPLIEQNYVPFCSVFIVWWTKSYHRPCFRYSKCYKISSLFTLIESYTVLRSLSSKLSLQAWLESYKLLIEFDLGGQIS